MTVQKQLKAIVVNQLCCEQEKVDALTDLQKDLGADSIDSIEIVIECEKEFNILIPDEDLHIFQGNFGDIVDYLEKKVQ